MPTGVGYWLKRTLDIDWALFFSVLALCAAGVVTMNSFGPENVFFGRQIIWVGIAVAVFFAASLLDYRFLRRTWPAAVLFFGSVVVLALVFVFGEIVKGSQRGFDLIFFDVQPTEAVKLVLIIVLAKYFARRHVEIADFRHILVSGAYAFVPFVLVLLQPDLGSALIFGAIWLGLVLVAGISWKHLMLVILTAALAAGGMWAYVLEDYQKQRVLTFLHPLADVQGAGYNAYQSTIAVGSGQLFGKGIGYGTQSKLKFLPEYQTDFIFASFAEEWGFAGVILLFILYGIVLWRILAHATAGASNFETLFAAGLAIMLVSHFVLHVGINIGVLPVTGTTIPFMSYGGSHLLIEFLGLGMLMGMRRYGRAAYASAPREEMDDFSR